MALMVVVRSTMALFSFTFFALQSGLWFLGDDIYHKFPFCALISALSAVWLPLREDLLPGRHGWLHRVRQVQGHQEGLRWCIQVLQKEKDNPMLAHNGHNKLSTHVVCLVNGTDQRHKAWGLQTATDSSTILKMIGQLNKSLVLTFSLSLWSMLLLGRWCRVLWWTTSNASLTMDPLDPDILISLSRSPSSQPLWT